jgi:hypothetical protein
MLSVIITCKDNKEKLELGTKIHESLQGSKIYADSDVLLNIDTPDTIYLAIGNVSSGDLTLHVKSDDIKFEEDFKK